VPDRDRDQAGADSDLHRELGQGWRRVRLGRVVARTEHGDRDHDRQRHQPPEHEGRALSHPALGGQHHGECRQRQRVECYRQADQGKVKQQHGRSSRLLPTEGVPVLGASSS
jgi:hypothetical protein